MTLVTLLPAFDLTDKKVETPNKPPIIPMLAVIIPVVSQLTWLFDSTWEYPGITMKAITGNAARGNHRASLRSNNASPQI